MPSETERESRTKARVGLARDHRVSFYEYNGVEMARVTNTPGGNPILMTAETYRRLVPVRPSHRARGHSRRLK